MEKIDYMNMSKKLHDYYLSAQKTLDIEFGISQSICKVGDIVKNSSQTVLVDKIETFKRFNENFPHPAYHGIALKKDLTPKKNGNRGSIYGNHNTELIKTKQK